MNKLDPVSEEAEAANAAYVWRREVQTQMLDNLRSTSISLEEAQWWFERFTRAYKREIETERVRREKEARI